MRLLAVALALSTGAGMGPADAVPVSAGTPAPSDGIFMTVERAALVSDAHARCLFERKELREALEKKPPTDGQSNLLLPVGLALFFGLAVGMILGARVLR